MFYPLLERFKVASVTHRKIHIFLIFSHFTILHFWKCTIFFWATLIFIHSTVRGSSLICIGRPGNCIPHCEQLFAVFFPHIGHRKCSEDRWYCIRDVVVSGVPPWTVRRTNDHCAITETVRAERIGRFRVLVGDICTGKSVCNFHRLWPECFKAQRHSSNLSSHPGISSYSAVRSPFTWYSVNWTPIEHRMDHFDLDAFQKHWAPLLKPVYWFLCVSWKSTLVITL